MKILSILAVTAALLFTGCKSVPTEDTMYTTSYAIGAAAGLVANQTKIDDEAREKVIEIVTIVAEVVPGTNETFEATWMEIAEDHAQKLVDKGDITAEQAELILGAVRVACKGIDYIFLRYPKAKLYESLVSAAVNGSTDGFLTVFRPVNGVREACGDKITYDVEAYNWLRDQAILGAK